MSLVKYVPQNSCNLFVFLFHDFHEFPAKQRNRFSDTEKLTKQTKANGQLRILSCNMTTGFGFHTSAGFINRLTFLLNKHTVICLYFMKRIAFLTS